MVADDRLKRREGSHAAPLLINGNRTRTLHPVAARARRRCDARQSGCGGRRKPTLKQFRDKLVAAGKPKLLAIIAVARKLLTILNAILRDQTPWRHENA